MINIMKYLNKLASVFFVGALGVLTMTSCEGGDLYNVGAPGWLSEMGGEEDPEPEPEEELVGQMEDVYNIGNEDLSSGFWTLGKTYVVPAGAKWQAQFNLTVNPDNKYYKNFYLVLNACTDAATGALGDEFGVIRYDNDPSKNSEWNTVGTEIDRSLVSGNFSNSSGDDETDASVQKMNGKITLTVDRTDGGLFIKMTNGTLTKTYTQTTSFPSTGADVPIACRIGIEGALVSFISTNIEPIGGCTSASDKQPLSMVLKGVPAKVLQGTDVETLKAGISAEVTFEELPAPVVVKAEDLEFQIIPNMDDLGTKTLVAAYGKTYKGEGASKPVIAYATFNVVDKLYTCVGNVDNSSAWWTAFSDLTKVAPGETFVSTFTNYTSGANNWNNFCIVLLKGDLTLGADGEYAVVRSDNYGWGNGYAACTPSGGQADWAAWLAAMDGAKVTTYVTNNGDGTADVKAVMVGTDGVTYEQSYIGINTIDPNDFYFRFVVDNSHMEFDTVIGAEDNSSPWWVDFSDLFKVPEGATYTTRFKNYSSGANNWNNFCVVLLKSDLTLGADGEYAVVRSDNYGWGNGYAACTPSGGQADWAAWLAAMDDATVTVSVTNKGTSADVKCIMVGNDGKTYTQDYIGISPIDGADFNFRYVMDGSHIVFE